MNLHELFFENATLFGGQVALIVMAIVFLILAVIFLAITVTGLFFRRKALKPAKTVPEQTAVNPENDQDEGELVAILTAAVAATRAQNRESGAFRVVSFKRR